MAFESPHRGFGQQVMGGFFGFFNYLSNHLGKKKKKKSNNQLAAKSINAELMVHEASAIINC